MGKLLNLHGKVISADRKKMTYQRMVSTHMQLQQIGQNELLKPFFNLTKVKAFYSMNDALFKDFSKQQNEINRSYFEYETKEGTEVRKLVEGKPVFLEGKTQEQFDEVMKALVNQVVEVAV